MEKMDSIFINALENGDLLLLKECEKGDLHNHSGRGGKLSYLAPNVIPPQKPFNDLMDMQNWFDANIKPIASGSEGGWLRRIEAAFHQAQEDNIKLLALNFGIGNIELLGGMNNFIKEMDALHQKQCPNTIFIPELGIGRHEDASEIYNKLDEILTYNYFKSIDLNCLEDSAPVQKFINIYRKAKEFGLIRKAHVGEFGSSEDVQEAVEILELNEVHHGIAAANSKSVMKFLADNKIRLNICPTSNYMLKVCSEMRHHPIRVLYDHGIPVSVNTDDLLIFNSSVSEEFLKLYQCGLMKAIELNEIRKCGLKERII